MHWSDISARQPALGAVADRLLIEPGVLLAGTIRRDGTARISGVEPLVLDGDLWLSMMSGSAKCRDLGRDPRVVLNSVITSPSPPAEIKVRGTARAVTGQERQERYAAAVRDQIGWQPVPGQFTLFIVEVANAPRARAIGPAMIVGRYLAHNEVAAHNPASGGDRASAR
jgi:hypothetical protein